MTPASFIKANRNFQRALARGDIDSASRWTCVIAEHIAVTRSLADLDTNKPRPKPRRKPAPVSAPATAPATPTMPVMLDPDGFSPGGTPNWFLNHQRLERAGLPISLAPQSRTDRKRANPTGP